METYRIRYLDGAELGAAIDLVREFMGVGLRAAKEIVETRGVILDEVSAAEARRVSERFDAIGAEVEVEQTWRHVYGFHPDDPARGDQPIARLRAGQRELTLDTGNLGAMYDGSAQHFIAPAETTRRFEAQLAHWRAEGRATAGSEIEVLEALSARDLALEAKLREDPSDVASHLIYGDWLQSRGDPRGALVMLQHALSEVDPGDRRTARELRRREREYRQRHLSHLFGPLRYTADAVAKAWSLGFLDAAFVGAGRLRASSSPLQTLRDLLRLPVAARLGSLGLTTRLLRRESVEQILCESEVAASLRELELGDHIPGGGDGPTPLVFRWLWSHLRRLRKLTLHSDRPPLRSLHSASLEHLELHMLGLPDSSIVSEITADGPGPGDSHPHHFVAGRLPRLRTLTLDFESAASMSAAAFAALLSLPEFDGVTELCLRLPNPLPVAIAEILASIPRLSGLEVLDLSRCTVDARGMAAIEHARGRGYLPKDLRAPMRI